MFGSGRVIVFIWLRLFATKYVVIGHSTYLNMQSIYGGVEYQLPDWVNSMYNSEFLIWFRQLPQWIYGFHMPLFFMLSGATLALMPIRAFDEVLCSEAKRLLPPTLSFTAFMLPIKRLGNIYP